MNVLPNTKEALVIRTDFDNQERWERICQMIRSPVCEFGQEFYARVEFLDEVQFRNLSQEDLLTRVPEGYNHSFLMVVDATAVQGDDFPVLLLDLGEEIGRSFRAVPSQIQAIENNLSLANMDFNEFADAVGGDGVFRGFA